ncbi:MAG: UDP-N-acetylmuramoyl-tripeptide--D-alanyl-D-alanine ligase [Dehalococcoidia bacterium]
MTLADISTSSIWVVVALATWLPAWSFGLVRDLHILQLEEYENGRFLRWWFAQTRSVVRLLPVGTLLILSLLSLPGVGPGFLLILAAIGAALANLVLVRRRGKHPAKKPLAWTARAKRLFGIAIGLSAVVMMAVGWVAPEQFRLFAVLLTTGMLLLISGPWLCGANLVARPVEASIRRYYLVQAGRRLREVGPVVVGITGSHGKTSTKEIVAALLAAKDETLKPPGSYNTLMGVCLTINRWLERRHRFFVVEMGAYGPGDIKALCDLVHPDAGILTAIGPEHLERFGSLENTERAKYELIEALPAVGFAVMNVDDERVRHLADSTRHVRVVRYGLLEDGMPEITADRIETGPDGISFDVVRGDERFAVRSSLLGRHNVSNLLAGIALALELDISPDQISRAVPRISAPDHRLQLIRTPGGATIVDDAYNANPAGVKAALDVLAEMTSGRKVLVTPGMVELGAVEAAENRRFGELAAAVCDTVVLVGPARTAPIREGLLGTGFPEKQIVSVRSLAEVTERLPSLAGAGDVVLFCNDLPDQYAE